MTCDIIKEILFYDLVTSDQENLEIDQNGQVLRKP